MKPASEWALEINARYEYEDDICLARLIERIQADAIEACAKECDTDQEREAPVIVIGNAEAAPVPSGKSRNQATADAIIAAGFRRSAPPRMQLAACHRCGVVITEENAAPCMFWCQSCFADHWREKNEEACRRDAPAAQPGEGSA